MDDEELALAGKEDDYYGAWHVMQVTERRWMQPCEILYEISFERDP